MKSNDECLVLLLPDEELNIIPADGFQDQISPKRKLSSHRFSVQREAGINRHSKVAAWELLKPKLFP